MHVWCAAIVTTPYLTTLIETCMYRWKSDDLSLDSGIPFKL